MFVATPIRSNRVWQTDLSGFETAGGGTWRISAVVDYATKTCLAATVVPTSAARDAIETIGLAIAEAERLLGIELAPLAIVSDNGPAYLAEPSPEPNLSEPESVQTS